MNCKRGGFVVMRHNNVRYFGANLLQTIQIDFEIESGLQKIDNERIDGRTRDEARPDIRAQEVWRQKQNDFFHAFFKKIKLSRQY